MAPPQYLMNQQPGEQADPYAEAGVQQPGVMPEPIKLHFSELSDKDLWFLGKVADGSSVQSDMQAYIDAARKGMKPEQAFAATQPPVFDPLTMGETDQQFGGRLSGAEGGLSAHMGGAPQFPQMPALGQPNPYAQLLSGILAQNAGPYAFKTVAAPFQAQIDQQQQNWEVLLQKYAAEANMWKAKLGPLADNVHELRGQAQYRQQRKDQTVQAQANYELQLAQMKHQAQMANDAMLDKMTDNITMAVRYGEGVQVLAEIAKYNAYATSIGRPDMIMPDYIAKGMAESASSTRKVERDVKEKQAAKLEAATGRINKLLPLEADRLKATTALADAKTDFTESQMEFVKLKAKFYPQEMRDKAAARWAMIEIAKGRLSVAYQAMVLRGDHQEYALALDALQTEFNLSEAEIDSNLATEIGERKSLEAQLTQARAQFANKKSQAADPGLPQRIKDLEGKVSDKNRVIRGLNEAKADLAREARKSVGALGSGTGSGNDPLGVRGG
jgi:hypothetical protein